jgi:hypothetical protein
MTRVVPETLRLPDIIGAFHVRTVTSDVMQRTSSVRSVLTGLRIHRHAGDYKLNFSRTHLNIREDSG